MTITIYKELNVGAPQEVWNNSNLSSNTSNNPGYQFGPALPYNSISFGRHQAKPQSEHTARKQTGARKLWL